MSQVLLMRPVMPVPEPPPRTAMAAPGVLPMYSSARIWTRLTIVSEPLIWIIFRAGAARRRLPRRARLKAMMTIVFFISFLLFDSQKDRKNVMLNTTSLFFVALALYRRPSLY